MMAMQLAEAANLLASRSLITGCGVHGVEICPEAELTGADVEALLGAALGTEVEVADYLQLARPPAPDQETFFPDIRLEEALGCGVWRYCPEQPITRGEMAAILAGAFEFEPTDADYFFDDEDHYAQAAINALVANEVFDICTAPGPLPFEPDRLVTRAELIDAIAKALDLIPAYSCRVMA